MIDLPPLSAEWISAPPPEQPAKAEPHSPLAHPQYEVLNSAVTTVDELITRRIEPRAVLMEPFLREGNLGFIYGVRGHGKTWIALFIATILSSGKGIGRWHAAKPVPTLLVDGEVDIDETQERLRLLRAAGPNLQILHHQDVFDAHSGRASLDLADQDQQQAVTQICETQGIKVLILDNLSALLRGVSENEGDQWEPIAHWLFDMRRRGIAVIIVHHAGRNGQMRGTSRREDPAHWIMKVERAESSGPDVTALTTRFEKYRRSSMEAPSARWEIQRLSATEITIKCDDVSEMDTFVQHVLDGVESATQIAELMGVSKGQVSKLSKKAADAGKIRVENKRYKPPGDGNENGNSGQK